MKVKDIISETLIIDEGIFGKKKVIPRGEPQKSIGDKLKDMSTGLIDAAIKYGRSYEETYSKFENRCTILRNKGHRFDMGDVKPIFDLKWKYMTREDSPKDTTPSHSPGAQIS